MAAAAAMGGGEDYLRQFVEETEWYNELVLGMVLPGGGDWWRGLPHPLRSLLRNMIGGYLVYYTACAFWYFVVYYWKPPKDYPITGTKAVWNHIILATRAMPFLAAIPTVSEYIIESGWTRCFCSISEVGWPMYLIYVALYHFFTEVLIYWAHRGLHEIKPLYKYVHATHHMFNKENTLSPFAGLAFNPVDLYVQGGPNLLALFFIPTHFATHLFLLFIGVIWSINIHDCVHGEVWPVMGAGYHTIHHTTYRHNYGNYTIFMDWLFGTLREPNKDAFKKD